MGMYTQIKVNCKLRKDVPDRIVKILKQLSVDTTTLDTTNLPKHDLFKTDRWRWVLCMDSAYFPQDHTTSALVKFDGQWHLLACANLKNYGEEIEKFFDWLQPYIDAEDGEIIGCHHYEEYDAPTYVLKIANCPTCQETGYQNPADCPFCQDQNLNQ